MRRRVPRSALQPRTRFNELWDNLPSLTVLAAFPGWGKSEWVRQCDSRLASVAPRVERRWVKDRDKLESLLVGSGRDAETVYLVDDVLLGAADPAWARITEFARRNPGHRFVVVTNDIPALPADAAGDCVVLDERHLAFTEAELADLAKTVAPGMGAGLFPPELRGCPYLVHRHSQRRGETGQQNAWMARVPPEAQLFRLWDETWSQDHRQQSVLNGALQAARYLRRIARDTLPRLRSDEQVVTLQFPRLAALPIFTAETDVETGAPAYAWTPEAWGMLCPTHGAAERQQGFEEALEHVRDAERVVGQVYYLMRLRRPFDAEEIIASNFRRCLVATDESTAHELRQRINPSLFPARALLIMGLPSHRPTEKDRDDAGLAMDAIKRQRTTDFVAEFGRQALLTYAAIKAARRTEAVEHLLQLHELLPTIEEQRVPVEAKERVADHLKFALELADHMGEPALADRLVRLL